MTTNKTKTFSAAIGAAFLAASVTPATLAAGNPFAAEALNGGYQLVADFQLGFQRKVDRGVALPGDYQLAAEHKSGEGKCGEGKCGGSKAGEEGKCGEGKCGGDKAGQEGKCGEGKCGGDKSTHEGERGGDKSSQEGKCGEGKCGGAA